MSSSHIQQHVLYIHEASLVDVGPNVQQEILLHPPTHNNGHKLHVSHKQGSYKSVFFCYCEVFILTFSDKSKVTILRRQINNYSVEISYIDNTAKLT